MMPTMLDVMRDDTMIEGVRGNDWTRGKAMIVDSAVACDFEELDIVKLPL